MLINPSTLANAIDGVEEVERVKGVKEDIDAAFGPNRTTGGAIMNSSGMA